MYTHKIRFLLLACVIALGGFFLSGHSVFGIIPFGASIPTPAAGTPPAATPPAATPPAGTPPAATPAAGVADYGTKTTADTAGLPTGGDIPGIIGNVVGAGLSLISVLFFVLLIYAGIMWMTARGDEGQTKKALDTIFAAIIGIIVVLAAYAITSFVLAGVSGTVSGGDAAKTDQACLDEDGECQMLEEYSTVTTPCTIGTLVGSYETGLCKSNLSTSYLCCVPNP